MFCSHKFAVTRTVSHSKPEFDTFLLKRKVPNIKGRTHNTTISESLPDSDQLSGSLGNHFQNRGRFQRLLADRFVFIEHRVENLHPFSQSAHGEHKFSGKETVVLLALVLGNSLLAFYSRFWLCKMPYGITSRLLVSESVHHITCNPNPQIINFRNKRGGIERVATA